MMHMSVCLLLFALGVLRPMDRSMKYWDTFAGSCSPRAASCPKASSWAKRSSCQSRKAAKAANSAAQEEDQDRATYHEAQDWENTGCIVDVISDHGCRLISIVVSHCLWNWVSTMLWWLVHRTNLFLCLSQGCSFLTELCLNLADLKFYRLALPPKVWHSRCYSIEIALSACTLCAHDMS